MSQSKPVVVFAPGAGFTPSHFAYVSHLLMQAGYPTLSGLLPSVGALNGFEATAEEDSYYVRDRLILPVLDNEQHDVIAVSHSYTGIPVGAALQGLGRAERTSQGKSTSVIGQIHIASLIPKGGDGSVLLAAMGGKVAPHMRIDSEKNLIRCDDPVPPLMQDVEATLARTAAISTVSPSLTCFNSPVPRATWDAESFKGRIAYIRTLQDHSVPLPVQDMFLGVSGQDWILKDIDSGHSPMLSKPDELVKIILELAQGFEQL